MLNYDPQAPTLGLLMVIVSILHLNNNVIEQETLFQLLSNLGLDPREECDDIPNWVDLIEKTFVRQLYLEKDKIADRVDSNGGEVYEYRMGPRSKIEFSTVNIVKFIAMVFGEELSDIQLKEAEDQDKDMETDDEDEE